MSEDPQAVIARAEAKRGGPISENERALVEKAVNLRNKIERMQDERSASKRGRKRS